jgi:hypothetical protein
MISVEDSQDPTIGVYQQPIERRLQPTKARKNSNEVKTQNDGESSDSNVFQTQSESMILSDHRVQIPRCTDRPNDSPFRPSFGSDAVAVVYRDRYRNHVA